MTKLETTEIERTLLRALPEATIYAVGGAVRDAVLGELGRAAEPSVDRDYLVAGVALESLIERLRAVGRAELVGASFGVIKFTACDTTVDVALPRREASTGAHHRAFDVVADPDIPIEEDLARRDFRMNMMASDLRTGAIVDPYGGRDDIVHGRLDALHARAFVEDPLRVLRGAQFAARFEFRATAATLDAMRAATELIPTIAPERIADELTKLLVKAPRPSIGFELMREVSALHHVLPELMEGWQVEQNEYHRFTVYYHSLACVDAAPADLALRLAALLHDIGKPRTKDGPHFYRHEFVGTEMARAALSRLRFSSDVIERVAGLVEHHMFRADDTLTDAAVRRFIRRVGPARVDELFTLRHADVIATGLEPRDAGAQERFERRVRAELAAAPPFGVRDLALRGDDVIGVMRELGLAGHDFAGDARVGDALKYALEQVLDDPRKNDPAVLRSIVRGYLEKAR